MIDVVQLFGQPAVSLDDAEQTGTVSGLQFEGNRIAAIDIGNGRTVPAAAVRTFEGDALTYDGVAAIAAPTESPAAESVELGAEADPQVLAGELPQPVLEVRPPWYGNPAGRLVLSTWGDTLGTLVEMHIEADGVVAQIVDDRGHSYSGDRLVTVGSFAAIVTPSDDDAA